MDFRVLKIVWELNGNIEQCTPFRNKSNKKNVAATSSIQWLVEITCKIEYFFGVQNLKFQTHGATHSLFLRYTDLNTHISFYLIAGF